MLFYDENTFKNFEIPSEWIYRGEGNCNVVISLPKSRKILRIRKTDKPKTIIGWIIILISDLLFWYCGKGVKDEMRDLKFYSLVMQPLIGNRYTSEATQVILSRKQVKVLESELDKYRPENRKTKNLQYGRAAIFDDFAYLPYEYENLQHLKLSKDVFSVEIKPKQGWRCSNTADFPECSFCMNQFRKIETNQIKKITKYCPEDLFSGDASRMIYSINSLIESPQNNFRIFKNGALFYGDKTRINFDNVLQNIFEVDNTNANRGLREEFCGFIQKTLTTNFERVVKCVKCSMGNNLPAGCVLEKILSVQNMDSNGSRDYNALLKGKGTHEDWNYVKKLLDVVENRTECPKCDLLEWCERSGAASDVDVLCTPYLISAIAKDCSLMVTFKRVISADLNRENVFRTKFGAFLVNIGVFDLYPKPLSTVRKHHKRNKDIFEAYLKATNRTSS